MRKSRVLDIAQCEPPTELFPVAMEYRLYTTQKKQKLFDSDIIYACCRNLFETEVELSATRKALSVLDKAVDRLMGEIAEASQEKEALYTKYQKIQDFKKLAVSYDIP